MTDAKDFGARMREAVPKGGSLRQIALAIGVSPEQLYAYGNTAVMPSDVDVIERLAAALHVSPEWLVFGRNPGGLVPVSYFVGAGDEVHAWGETIEYVNCPGANPERHIVAMVRGDSMEPYVQHFDMIMAIRAPAYSPEEIASHNIPAMVETTEGHAWLKKIRPRREKGRYDLLSFNPAFNPIEDVEIEWCAPVIRRWSPVFGEDV